MKRAFKMQLKPNCVELYKQRHDEIWPELVLLLKGYGICDYHIYLASDQLTLFATCEVPDNFDEETLQNLAPASALQPGMWRAFCWIRSLSNFLCI